VDSGTKLVPRSSERAGPGRPNLRGADSRCHEGGHRRDRSGQPWEAGPMRLSTPNWRARHGAEPSCSCVCIPSSSETSRAACRRSVAWTSATTSARCGHDRKSAGQRCSTDTRAAGRRQDLYGRSRDLWPASPPRQMRLANVLCRYLEIAHVAEIVKRSTASS
jgi:hypothetical protein